MMTNILDEIADTPLEGPLEPKKGCEGVVPVLAEGIEPSKILRDSSSCPVCTHSKPINWIKSNWSGWYVVYHSSVPFSWEELIHNDSVINIDGKLTIDND